MAGMYPDNQELSIFGEKVQWPGVDSSGKFTNGSFTDPLVKPSFIPAETINLILDNLSELIKKLGGTPNNKSTKQLAELLGPASQGSLGTVKTVNRAPNKNECEKNEPWAASPNWVYNLLTGNSTDDVKKNVNNAVFENLGLPKIFREALYYKGTKNTSVMDSLIETGLYSILRNGYSSGMIVLNVGGSLGVVQIWKDGYTADIPWKYRNAIDGNIKNWTAWRSIASQELVNEKVAGLDKEFVRKTQLASQGDTSNQKPQQGLGIVKLTKGMPSKAECNKDVPWAASPNWVYNLLTGNVSGDIKKEITEALKKQIGGGIKQMSLTDTVGYVEWENEFKMQYIKFSVKKDFVSVTFPLAFKTKPILISVFGTDYTPYLKTNWVSFDRVWFDCSLTGFRMQSMDNKKMFACFIGR